MASCAIQIAPNAVENRGILPNARPTIAPTLREQPYSIDAANERTAAIRMVLVEGDPDTAAYVRTRLTHPDFEIIAETSSGEEGLRSISNLRPDVVFIDISLLESCGLPVTELLHQPFTPVIVILTTQPDRAVQAFELGAADCLLKPIRRERFEISLQRVREKVAQQSETNDAVVAPGSRPVVTSVRTSSNHIIVADRKRTHVIKTSEIEWIGAAGDYTEIHVQGATHLLREPLSVLLGRLPAQVFCRIHRSFAVNLTRVSGFKTLRNQDLLVRLKDRTLLRASRTFSDELKRAIRREYA